MIVVGLKLLLTGKLAIGDILEAIGGDFDFEGEKDGFSSIDTASNSLDELLKFVGRR